MNLRLTLNVLRAIRQLRQHEQWTRPELLAHQATALADLRAHAYAHSPFYQRFHAGLTSAPLSALPVLTKATLMEHFDEVVTDPAVRLAAVRDFAAQRQEEARFLGRYWVTATSGSSGQPGFFLFDEPEWFNIMASFARGQEWSGARIDLRRRRRMATVASVSPWHMSSQVAAAARTWWTPSLRLPATDPLADLIGRLNDWQPDLLIAYASMARILADAQLDGRLRIAPQKTFTSSEVLTPETRRRVQAAWGDEPYNQYGATETADIAAEHQHCRHMHLFEDLVIVEPVDEHHRPVPPGEFGAKLLVTILFSFTQPLIRYELNDSVRLAVDACECGLPFGVLEAIQGRVEDALSLPRSAGGRVPVQPLVFNRVMDVLPLSGWQVRQESDEELTILLGGVHGTLTDEEVAAQLRAALAEQGVKVPRLMVQRVPEIPKTAAGKTPQVTAHRPSMRQAGPSSEPP
jgi:phenylacetate-CoA ligase